MTNLTYMNAPKELEIDAMVTEVEEIDGRSSLVLDRTPIYPQGGGQPSDIGTVEGDGYLFEVGKAVLIDGVVHHTGVALRGDPVPGPAKVTANRTTRELHAAVHSGGHLIMTAMFELNGIRAVKGYHFPDGPYVEFEGSPDEAEREGLVAALQDRLDAMVAADEEIRVEAIDARELAARGIFSPVPPPAGKPCRVVTTCGYRSPCGGTHVARSGDLEGLRVRRIKSKKGRTRVAYEIGGDADERR
jgi:Ser-tRNA(Ala) deacylase AlaX